MKTIDYRQVEIRKGFFKELQKLNAEVSVYNIYKRLMKREDFVR